MLVRSSDGKFEDIDFREVAPAAAFQDMYNKNTVRQGHALSRSLLIKTSRT